MAFAHDQFLQSVIVQIGQERKMGLGPGIVDPVLFPGSFTTTALALLQPVQPIGMSHAPDEISITVFVHIKHQDGDAGGAQVEIAVPGPGPGSALLQPSLGCDNIAASVAVDIAGANTMSLALRGQGVLGPLGLAPDFARLIPGLGPYCRRQDIHQPVTVDVP